MRIYYSNKFLKQLTKAPIEVRSAFRSRLEIFLSNSKHPLLRNHELIGQYVGYRSINVTGDWRAIFQELNEISFDGIYFFRLGTHSQLYR